jgi:Ca2+-binding EF-hand superfamily protein
MFVFLFVVALSGRADAQTIPALHPGSGLAATSALSVFERDGLRPSGPRHDAGPTTVASAALHRVLPPFRFSDDQINIPSAQEVIFFTEQRPVRVRLHVKVAGKSLVAEWKAQMRKLFDFFDRDGDGVLNSYEAEYVFSNRGVQQMIALGNAMPGFTDPNRSLADFDKDGDGNISFDEFLAYYNTSAEKLVSIRPNPFRDAFAETITEELFKLLDANKDGKLSKEELAGAELLLRSRDLDEDECLSATELVPDVFNRQARAGTPNAASAAANRVGEPLQVYPVGGIPETIFEQLLKRYDKDGNLRLTKAEIGLDDATFARLDRNGNGELSVTELMAWREGPPDLEIELTLGAKPSESSAKVLPGPDGKAPPLASALRFGEPGKAFLHLGNQQLEFNTYAPQGAFARPVQAAAAQLSFPDNGRGYITEKDVAQAGPQLQYLRVLFDTLDRDADGKVTRAEFDTYFRVQQGFQSLPLSVTFGSQVPSLFQILDVNSDGRLSVRELRNAWARLHDLEPSGGEYITRAAIQAQGTIRFGRTLQVNTAGQEFPYAVRQIPTNRGPLWFRKMDRNSDGELSRSEFLGRSEEFDRIDADHDGRITAEEAEAYDKAQRTAEAASTPMPKAGAERAKD